MSIFSKVILINEQAIPLPKRPKIYYSKQPFVVLQVHQVMCPSKPQYLEVSSVLRDVTWKSRGMFIIMMMVLDCNMLHVTHIRKTLPLTI